MTTKTTEQAQLPRGWIDCSIDGKECWPRPADDEACDACARSKKKKRK